MKKRIERVGLLLTPSERTILKRLAEIDGLSEAATIRRLLHQAAREAGRHGPAASPVDPGLAVTAEVAHAQPA